MRLAPPPPDVCLLPRHEHDGLLRSLSLAMAVLGDRNVLASALAGPGIDELGAIDLPPGPAGGLDRVRLRAAAPLYFAAKLEDAGLLATAELIAGLFASGAITQPIGPVARLLNDFWRARRERLGEGERAAIFARAIEPPYFDQLMAGLCEAIVVQADGSDIRERVVLETAIGSLAEFLSLRVDPMAAMAARDIVENINQALGFMRDRMLQTAFGVHSLWALVAVAGDTRGQGAGLVQRHVDLGRAGQTVLLWLADHAGTPAPTVDPGDLELIGAAQRWLSGRIENDRQAATTGGTALPALPAVA
ncbi:hypothetical protein [Marilutibacter chinensis]|uniref:Uncharacterized protein n=1 Tax=Marilutibacter chinensis TaxID=2912247 RepID=A0ABS9HPI7_9GAMM|nr:hypothetical protein [Lysobacter chinensis]MCF7220870.1 hypothetical protein [Lysobacter chinensis]